MKRLLIFGALASAVWFGSTSNVKADESVRIATETAVAQAALGSTHLQDWRYRWHNGQWWYYTPGNYWMTYNNGAWNRWNGGVGVGAYVGPRYNYYRGYPYYGNNYYRGYPYYGYRGYGYGNRYYRGYGPGGVAGRAVIRALR